jgi:prophage maintenance system killer protein
MYLVVEEVFKLHCRVIEQTGRSLGVRYEGALASAVSQPQMKAQRGKCGKVTQHYFTIHRATRLLLKCSKDKGY